MASSNINDDFFDESFYDRLTGKNTDPLAQWRRVDYTQLKSAADQVNRTIRLSMNSERKTSLTPGNSNRKWALMSISNEIRGGRVKQGIDKVIKELNNVVAPKFQNQVVELITIINGVYKAMVDYSVFLGVDISKGTAFSHRYYRMLRSAVTPQNALDTAKGAMYELAHNMVILARTLSQMSTDSKLENGEDSPEVDEDSVGTMLPVTAPNEVLRKKETEPTVEEAFDALSISPNNFRYDEEKEEVQFNKSALNSIESFVNSTLRGKGYIPFSKMQVSKTTATKALDKSSKQKGDLRTQVKVTTVTAKYKNKAICTIELSDADKNSGYKYALESSAINPEFELSGWLAYVHLCVQNGFVHERLNRELDATVKDIQKNKFKMKDSVVLEGVEDLTYDGFVYDESGEDVMPFTTDIQLVNENGEAMVIWEDAEIFAESGKWNSEPVDRTSLNVIEKYAEKNLVSSGYIPFSKLKIDKEDVQTYGNDDILPSGSTVTYIAIYNKKRIAQLKIITTAFMSAQQQLKINPDFSLTGFIAGIHLLDTYGKKFEKKYNKKLKKYADQIMNGTFKKHDRLVMESGDEFHDILDEHGIDSVIAQYEECDDLVDVWEGWDDDEVITEAAKIDDDIKDIITALNTKGYKTIYSCSGHPSAKLKSDVYRDGIKDGKLYSTARVVFDKKYDFGGYPEGWEPKEMKDGKFGIYVKGPTYNIVKGMQTDQFSKWKKRYMYHLEKWAKALPDSKNKSKKSDSAAKRYAEKGI